MLLKHVLFKIPVKPAVCAVLLGFIVLAACSLQFAAVVERDLHMDEALYARIGGEIAVKGNYLLEGVWIFTPPLFYVVSSIFFSVFGFTQEIAYLPNFFGSLLSVVMIFLITRSLAGMEAALLASFCAAFSPLQIGYAVTTFLDPLVAFFILLSIVMILKQKPLLGGIFYGCAIATKQIAPVFAPLIVAFLVLSGLSYDGKTADRSLMVKNLWRGLAGMLLIVLPLLWWSLNIQIPRFGSFVFGQKKAFDFAYIEFFSRLISWVKFSRGIFFGSIAFASAYALLLIFTIIVYCTRIRSFDRTLLQKLAVHLCVLCYFLLISATEVPYWGRYLIVILPWMMISIAIVVHDLFLVLSRRFNTETSGPFFLIVPLVITLLMLHPYADIATYMQGGKRPISKGLSHVSATVKQMLLQSGGTAIIHYDQPHGLWKFQYYFYGPNMKVKLFPLRDPGDVVRYRKEMRSSALHHFYVAASDQTKIERVGRPRIKQMVFRFGNFRLYCFPRKE